MAKSLTPKTFVLTGLAVAVVLVACGGGGGGDGAAAPPVIAAGPCVQSLKTGFTGNFETARSDSGDSGGAGGGGGAAAGGGLGKVLGGQMTVTDLSNGTVLGTATTDATSGLVTVKTCGLAGPFLLTLEGKAGAKYYDEGLNQLVDFSAGKTLHALVDAWDEHVGVSPLTEAAYRYALNNFKANPAAIAAGTSPLLESGSATGLTTAQVLLANNLVKTQINNRYVLSYQMSSAKSLPTPLDTNSSATTLKDNRYGRSAAINGGLVKAANFYNPSIAAPALSFVNDLARDLTDGRIDGFALDGSPVGSSDAATYNSVRLPLGGMVGTSFITKKFGLTPSVRTVDEISANGFDEEDTTLTTGVCNGWYDIAALLSDGSVTIQRNFASRNSSGRCGYPNGTGGQNFATFIPNFLTDVKQLGTGAGFGMYAVKNDGTVVGWGRNYCGQISPNLPLTYYQTPQVVPGLKDITSIGNSYGSPIARDKSGTIYVWGTPAGAAGNTPTAPSGYTKCATEINSSGATYYNYMLNAPLKFSSATDIVDVYAFGRTYFAIAATGDTYAWGEAGGKLGNAPNAILSGGFLIGPAVATPTLIAGLGKVKSLGYSAGNVYALMLDGTIKAWGDDFQGLLGNGTRTPTPKPTTFPGLTGIESMAVHDVDGLRMLKYDGSVVTWGWWLVNGQQTTFNPKPFTPPERIRHLGGRGSNFFVYFESGKIGNNVDLTYNLADSFK